MQSDRRTIIGMLAVVGASAALPRRLAAADAPLRLDYGATRGATIPGDFVGLSFERAQLTNPGYFSPRNTGLVRLVRELAPKGNLRLGGSSGEHTPYVGDVPPAPGFVIFGPEHTKTVKEGLSVSTTALHELRGFLDATGWDCLYGLGMAHATPAQVAREAADVQRILGPRLTALQIGNEPDAFRNRYRPATWGPADYVAEWDRFHAAAAAAVPGVRFAGPDISNKLDYLTAFAAAARTYPDIVMLTGHYYAMGPSGSPEATLDQLWVPEAKTATFKAAGFAAVDAARRTSGLPYRMAEGNSCWDGGKAGVSDVHAAALWGAERMLAFAQQGWIGVNWHGGGNGVYSPVVGTPQAGFTRRPLYFGTRFAAELVGATFLDTHAPTDPMLGFYALRQDGRDRIVAINKRATAKTVRLPAAAWGQAMVLSGPSATARDATVLHRRPAPAGRTVTIPPFTAMLLTLAERRG